LLVGVPYIGVADPGWYVNDTKKELLRSRLHIIGRYQDHIESCQMLNDIGIMVNYPEFPDLTRPESVPIGKSAILQSSAFVF